MRERRDRRYVWRGVSAWSATSQGTAAIAGRIGLLPESDDRGLGSYVDFVGGWLLGKDCTALMLRGIAPAAAPGCLESAAGLHGLSVSLSGMCSRWPATGSSHRGSGGNASHFANAISRPPARLSRRSEMRCAVRCAADCLTSRTGPELILPLGASRFRLYHPLLVCAVLPFWRASRQ